MNKEELATILDKHQKWLNDEPKGKRANLRGVNLHKADLRGANLYGANLSEANLSKANLSEAKLSKANLYVANLHKADLCGANLYGANLYGASGNSGELKTPFVSEVYPVAYTSDHLQIGCEGHLILDWWSFDNDRIEEMDGQQALVFWAQWKPVLQQLIEQNPATPTGHEGKEQ